MRLSEILKDHELWVESDGERGNRAVLTGVNLQGDRAGANLAGANFQRSFFLGANLRGTIFTGADLAGADLEGACLAGADLSGADLRNAKFQNAILVGANFSTNFKNVQYFYGATFSEDQSPWVVLHPKYSRWADTLKWVKAGQLSA